MFIARILHNILILIGNYYSLRGDHEKAVLYFRQALKLNPKHVVAWTLLGHEFVELKNTSAAIESYRRATGIVFVYISLIGCWRSFLQEHRLQILIG